MQLYFIRHGQSLNNLLWDQTKDDQGRSEDPELSEYGQKQVEILAQFLAHHNGPLPTTRDANAQNIDHFGLTHLYTSPMVRSMDTAGAIARHTNLTPVVWKDLHETGGVWLQNEETGEPIGLPGNKRAFFEARYPNFILSEDLGKEGWWNSPFESHEERVMRASRFINNLKAQHGDTNDRIAVVSHGAFYNYMLGALLNLPLAYPPESIWFALNNTGITRIDFQDGRLRMAYQNRVDFLPPALVT